MIGVSTGLGITLGSKNGCLAIRGKLITIKVELDAGQGKLLFANGLCNSFCKSCRTAFMAVKSMDINIDPEVFFLRNFLFSSPIPLDGSSAGVAIAVAIISLVTMKSVDPDIGIMGEISSDGFISSVGSLPAKLFAAKENGLKAVVLPASNYSQDLLKYDLNIIPAEKVEDILEYVLPW